MPDMVHPCDHSPGILCTKDTASILGALMSLTCILPEPLPQSMSGAVSQSSAWLAARVKGLSVLPSTLHIHETAPSS